MNRVEKYNIIKQEIDRWDPVFLYEIGCPPNEYSTEVTKISSKINDYTDVNSLAMHIYNVFLDMFGNETDSKAKEFNECKKIAKIILEKIKEN